MKKFDYYCRHLQVLKSAEKEDLENEFIISGIIDKFFIQFELGWKVMKALLLYEGDSVGQTGSPRDVIKEAYRYFGFMDEEVWLKMLRERNDTTHIYDGNAAKELVQKILIEYIKEFQRLQEAVEKRYGDIIDTIL